MTILLAQSAHSFTAAQSLTLLLTTESLLFAALSISVTLSSPTLGGRGITRRDVFRLAAAVVTVLGFIAIAAGFAWWQIFGDNWPTGWLSRIEGIGIAVGIVAELGIAIVITKAVRD
jgi:hypothetical protein